MDLPLYLHVLWRYRLLLLIGVLVAATSGILAGYRVTDGGLVPRAESVYSARTTLILSQPGLSPFQTESEPVEVDPESVTVVEQRNNLSELALIYAYVVTGTEISGRVEAAVGALGELEEVTALRRSTQPNGDERFPGRSSLPIIDVVARSTEPARAELLSAETARVFRDYVAAAQQQQGIDEPRRVAVDVLREPEAEQAETSSPLLPVILVAGAVFLAFVAAAFILHNVSTSPYRAERARRRAAARTAAGAGPAPGAGSEPAPAEPAPGEPAAGEPAPAPARPYATSSSRTPSR